MDPFISHWKDSIYIYILLKKNCTYIKQQQIYIYVCVCVCVCVCVVVSDVKLK